MRTFDSLIRVSKMGSRTESADSTMTVDDQRDANMHAITAAGAKLGKEYLALDVSGYSVTTSPQWREALERCQSGESAGIVVAYFDRLTRNSRAIGPYLDDLEKAGAEVIIAGMPGVDYRTPEGRMATGMLSVVSDMNWQVAKARGDRIAEATMARGVPNLVSFGYRRNEVDGVKIDPDRDAKALVPDPQTAPHVQLVYRLRADAWSWAQIADELDRLGVPTARGGRWTKSTLASMVRNEAYLGVVALGARRVIDAHEPLVDKALWHRAQSTRRAPARSGRLIAGLAGGLVTCSHCGGTMSVVGGRDGRNGSRVSYSCPGRWTSGKCPHPLAIAKPVVDDLVDTWVVRGIEGLEPFDIFVGARELEAARIAAQRATDKRKQIVAMTIDWDPEDADVAYRAARDAEAAAQAHYDQLAARDAEAACLPADADAWHALTLEDRRAVLRLLLERIEIAPPLSRSKFASVAARVKFVERGSGA